MFKSKKGFLLRDVVITGLLFTGIIALFVIGLTSISINYDRTDLVNEQFNKNFNKLNDLTSGQSGLDTSRSQLTNASGLQLLGNFDIAFQSTWTVFALVWGTVDLYASMGSNIVSTFTFIPAVVIKVLLYILVSILVAYIIFNLISSITRGRV